MSLFVQKTVSLMCHKVRYFQAFSSETLPNWSTTMLLQYLLSLPARAEVIT